MVRLQGETLCESLLRQVRRVPVENQDDAARNLVAKLRNDQARQAARDLWRSLAANREGQRLLMAHESALFAALADKLGQAVVYQYTDLAGDGRQGPGRYADRMGA